jgi:predicted RNA methylase
MRSMSKQISQDAMVVLSNGRCVGDLFYLPQGQLDRKLYEDVNKVLTALGGKWNRSMKAHAFGAPCADQIESAIETGTYDKPSDMGWFPTPASLADYVVSMGNVNGQYCLEPSAGTGAIVRAMIRGGARSIYAMEIDEGRATTVDNIGCVDVPVDVNLGDFLQLKPRSDFDRVVMNPPFAKRADIHHVTHARKFLRPGGLLVAIMSAGVAFREDRLATEFRSECESIKALPEDSFKSSGTSVNTVVVTMRALH